jgi:hypothetical protein
MLRLNTRISTVASIRIAGSLIEEVLNSLGALLRWQFFLLYPRGDENALVRCMIALFNLIIMARDQFLCNSHANTYIAVEPRSDRINRR